MEEIALDKSELSTEILSDLIVHSKYARHIKKEKRKETWKEICIRNRNMHLKRYKDFPELHKGIKEVYRDFVIPKKVLPSLRSAQFAGKPIELTPSRLFNCSYLPINHWKAFSEIMFLLLGGSGIGISIQKHHINELPEIRGPLKRKRRFLISDNIEGWADTIKVLMQAYFEGKSDPIFDYSDIREKGEELITSGGKAPGPQPLKDCVHNIRKILDTVESGDKLKPIQAYDICAYIADAVLSGGIRRAACISLFSYDDIEMLHSKFGNWWEKNPQRARSNNSVVLLRHRITKKKFLELWDKIKLSGCGEPAFYFTNDKNELCNPCGEASLKEFQFCNLTEINANDIKDQADFNARARAASFIGTLQAGYTNFHYLRDVWQRNTEKDSLLGVGITGIAANKLDHLSLEQAAEQVVKENEHISSIIGINPASRTTTIKPSGTSSLVVGSSSGIHPWYSEYYIRRLRVNKEESIYKYLKKKIPKLLEDDFEKPHLGAIINIPIKAPSEATLVKDETALQFLEKVKRFQQEWIRPGHKKGSNTHNVSCTVAIKEHEWDEVGEWMWKNRKVYNGITVYPYFDGTIPQAPHEACTKERYEELLKHLKKIDLMKVIEEEDNTKLTASLACSGGSCTITNL